MKKTSDQNPRSGPGRTGDTTQPSKDTPLFSKSERIQDPKETAQEAAHQVTPRDAIKKKEDVKSPPLHAAKGNDEVMSQPPSRSQP
jgi:hypothetical protein